MPLAAVRADGLAAQQQAHATSMHYHGCDNAGGSGNRCHAYVVPAMCVARLPLNVGKPLRALLRPWEAAQLRRPPGRGVAANAVGARRDLRALLEVREALDLVRATDVRLHPWTIPTCALSSAATCISAPCSKSVGNVDQAIKGWHLRVGIPAMKIPDHHRPPARKPCKQGWARRAGRWTAHHALRANAVNMSRRRSLPKAGAWRAAGRARPRNCPTIAGRGLTANETTPGVVRGGCSRRCF